MVVEDVYSEVTKTLWCRLLLPVLYQVIDKQVPVPVLIPVVQVPVQVPVPNLQVPVPVQVASTVHKLSALSYIAVAQSKSCGIFHI